jgi:hypothetical protein
LCRKQLCAQFLDHERVVRRLLRQLGLQLQHL